MSAHQVLAQLANADWNIADPGASGTITVLRSGTCEIISAGSEDRTLAAPTKSDLEIAIVGKTIPSGTVTVTMGSLGAYTEAGDTNFTITAAGQFMILRSFEVAAATFEWRKVASDGIGSSTVALASEISIADAGNYTVNTNVETALQELLLTENGVSRVGVPLTAISKEDGTQMIKQATTVTGFAQLANKNLVIHIPANSTAEAFAFTVDLPTEMGRDMLAADAGVYIDVVVSKDANADTLTLDCEGYVLDPDTGAPTWGADRYAGSAKTITQAAVTLSFELTLIASNATALPQAIAGVLTLGGTNDSDVVYIHSVSVRAPKAALIA